MRVCVTLCPGRSVSHLSLSGDPRAAGCAERGDPQRPVGAAHTCGPGLTVRCPVDRPKPRHCPRWGRLKLATIRPRCNHRVNLPRCRPSIRERSGTPYESIDRGWAAPPSWRWLPKTLMCVPARVCIFWSIAATVPTQWWRSTEPGSHLGPLARRVIRARRARPATKVALMGVDSGRSVPQTISGAGGVDAYPNCGLDGRWRPTVVAGDGW